MNIHKYYFAPLILLIFLLPNAEAGITEIDPTPKTIPTVIVDGKTLSFDYTDDNRNEDLIIRTTQETYQGFSSASVYVSVTNINPLAQFVDLQVYFNRPNESVSRVYELVQNIPYQITLNDFSRVSHVCPDPWVFEIKDPIDEVYTCEITNEVYRCDSIDGNTCTVNKEFIGSHEETRFKDEWQPIAKTSQRDTETKRLELSKEIPPSYLTREKATKLIASDETKFFKVDIKFPPQTRNEFYIEAIGSTAYGLLDPFFDSDWLLRKAITINSTEVGSDLTNFPLLINFTDSDLQTDAQADGDDIVFTDSDEVTQLDHEIEDYDSSDGTLTAWVRVNVTSASDKVIYIYYNNSAASAQNNTNGVWRDEYLGVWHWNDDFLDSTSNEHHGTNVGTTNFDDPIATGFESDATSDYISIPDQASLEPTKPFTISGWIKTTAGGNTVIFEKDGNSGYSIQGFFTGIRCVAFSAVADSFGGYSNDEWFLYHCSYETPVSFIFMNGTDQTSSNSAGVPVYGVVDLCIGSRCGSVGQINEHDESRIYNGTLSDDWIAFEHCNQRQNSFINGSNNFCPAWSVGNEENNGNKPTAPTSLTATAVTQSQIDLEWVHNLNNGTNGFRIHRESPIGDGFTVLVANTTNTDTFYNNTGVNCDQQYNYRVTALNINGSSPFSNEADATIICDTVFNAILLKLAAPNTTRLGGAFAITCPSNLTLTGLLENGTFVCSTITISTLGANTSSSTERIAVRITNTTIQSDNTQNNDIYFQFPLEANKRYYIEWVAIMESHTNAFFAHRLTFDQDAMGWRMGAGDWQYNPLQAQNFDENFNAPTNTGQIMLFNGQAVMRIGSTNGNLIWTWAQVNSDATDTTVYEGSWMKVTELG